MSGRKLGALLSGAGALLLAYEFAAILTPLPTLSRLWQGLRDASMILAVGLGVVAVGVGLGLTAFAGWLVWHFTLDERSDL